MPTHAIPGFTPRSLAQKKYGRSKSSFIRDVDDAFARGDEQFLSHFRVRLKDGDVIEGPDATKEVIQTFQSMQPRWYIATELLETRYWDQGAAEGELPIAVEKAEKSDDADVKHQLALAEQRIETQSQTISRLEDDKTFLQSELENRRGEIDKLQAFFTSVGEAADSTARLRAGRDIDDATAIDATVADGFVDGSDTASVDGSDTASVDGGRNGAMDGSETVVQRYLPTFHRAFSKFRFSK